MRIYQPVLPFDRSTEPPHFPMHRDFHPQSSGREDRVDKASPIANATSFPEEILMRASRDSNDLRLRSVKRIRLSCQSLVFSFCNPSTITNATPHVLSPCALGVGLGRPDCHGGGLAGLVGGWVYAERVHGVFLKPPQLPLSTAASFTLSGFALLVLRYRERVHWVHFAAFAAAALTVAIGIITLTVWAFLPYSVLASTIPIAWRTSTHTGSSLILAGAALLNLAREARPERQTVTQWAALFVCLISLVALLGHTYGVGSFFRFATEKGMMVYSAALLLLLGVGILFEDTDRGFMKMFASPTAAGIMARRLLPSSVLLLLALAASTEAAGRFGFYRPETGRALFATSGIVIIAILIWFTGRRIAVIEHQREESEKETLRLYEELKAAHETTLAANRARDQFLAMLNHELRTPLTPALLTLAELRSQPHSPAELQAELLELERNIQLQVRLVDDLLDLTRIRTGKLHLQPEACDVHEVD